MSHLSKLGNTISIQLPVDERGFLGRECPYSKCKGYFKIKSDTDRKGEETPRHCPYCGHTAGHDQFFTPDQYEYAKSIALRRFMNAFDRDLKTLEFDHQPKGPFGIGISLKVQTGRPVPIHHYRERELETEIVCLSCALRYCVYGVFAFCPNCGRHNSLGIFKNNLEIVRKMLDLARGKEPELSSKLIENALEDCVSAFDAFGRELCRVHTHRALNPTAMKNINFQNLNRSCQNLRSIFKVELADSVQMAEWRLAVKLFQKRHLIAHKMGVVDEEYVKRADDSDAVVGRKITICAVEVEQLVDVLNAIAESMSVKFDSVGR